MELARALLYLAAVALILTAALGARTRISLPLLGTGLALLAYALPAITSI